MPAPLCTLTPGKGAGEVGEGGWQNAIATVVAILSVSTSAMFTMPVLTGCGSNDSSSPSGDDSSKRGASDPRAASKDAAAEDVDAVPTHKEPGGTPLAPTGSTSFACETLAGATQPCDSATQYCLTTKVARGARGIDFNGRCVTKPAACNSCDCATTDAATANSNPKGFCQKHTTVTCSLKNGQINVSCQ